MADACGRRAASGPWLDLWRAVLALGDIPCAPWVMALAAWDIAHGGAEWFEHLPQPVATIARRVAAGVRKVAACPPYDREVEL